MTIVKIDRATARAIADRVKEFTNSLEAEFGIKCDKVNTTYTDTVVQMKVFTSVALDKRGLDQKTPEEDRYDFEAGIHDLPPRGTQFVTGDKTFTIKEWMPRGRKYKIIAENNENGRRHKFTVDGVKRLTGRF